MDDDFGPFFIKLSTYFPYTAKLCINGNEWAKRQAAKAGIAFEALDNGFAAVDDVDRLQNICDSLGPDQIDALLRKWLRDPAQPVHRRRRSSRLPLRTVDPAGGVLLTQMLDRPARDGFFEQARADYLTTNRPVAAHRGGSSGRSGCRSARCNGRQRVSPALHVDYKNTKIKQYHKQGRALRTETTINDTRDFRLPKRLTSLPALRQLGFTANGACSASNPSATTRSAAPRHSPTSPPRSSPAKAHASPDFASATTAFTPPAGPAHPPAPTQRVHQP